MIDSADSRQIKQMWIWEEEAGYLWTGSTSVWSFSQRAERRRWTAETERQTETDREREPGLLSVVFSINTNLKTVTQLQSTRGQYSLSVQLKKSCVSSFLTLILNILFSSFKFGGKNFLCIMLFQLFIDLLWYFHWVKYSNPWPHGFMAALHSIWWNGKAISSNGNILHVCCNILDTFPRNSANRFGIFGHFDISSRI